MQTVFYLAHDRLARGARDRERIDVHQDHELRHWSKKFGVSPEQLKQAGAAAGTDADKVEAWLRERDKTPT